MTKLINKPLEVKCDKTKLPRSFLYREKWLPVSRILEIWKDTGTWWDGESEKTFYRVQAAEGCLYELYLDTAKQLWFLYRVYD